MAAICDLDRDRAEQSAKQFGVAECYTDFGEMLDTVKPDFVDIVTRPESHLALTREAAGLLGLYIALTGSRVGVPVLRLLGGRTMWLVGGIAALAWIYKILSYKGLL